MPEIKLDYTPQDRQWVLHNTNARQILYGGAAGGGKSYSTRWDAILFALENPGFQGYLFRRKRTELIGTHIRAAKYEICGKGIAEYSESRNALEFFNRSVIYMCFADNEDDVRKYLSEEMHWLGLDEASQMTPTQIGFLCTRVRLGGWKPTKDDGRLPRVVFATNPGGPSHSFLKEKFQIGIQPPEVLFYDKTMMDPNDKDSKGWSSIYIPAKIADNKFLDTDYGAAFGGLPPDLAKAYREGDWNVIVGQALFNLRRDRHMLPSFAPPVHWTKFMSMDWGLAAPFSIGWYCVSDGATLKITDEKVAKELNIPMRNIYLPPGSVIRFREWYGWNGKTNQGCRMEPQSVAEKIKEIEKNENIKVDYRVADTEMWSTSGGPAPIDHFFELDLSFQQSIKDRIRNYNEIISRLAGNKKFLQDGEEGKDPMLYVTSDCEHWWRTCPILQLDQTFPEKGPSEKEENHAYDETAYGLASVPYVTTKKQHDDDEFLQKLRRSSLSQPPYSAIRKRWRTL